VPNPSVCEGFVFDFLCGSWLQPRHKKAVNDLLPFGGLFAEPCARRV
jgi:hypothetical protein